MGTHPDEGQQPPASAPDVLRSALMRKAAGAIRSLDSRLERIIYLPRVPSPVLLYTFALAGREETFEVAVEPVMASVADLYPAAAPLEAELAHRHGITFQRHEEAGGP